MLDILNLNQPSYIREVILGLLVIAVFVAILRRMLRKNKRCEEAQRRALVKEVEMYESQHPDWENVD